MDRTWTGNPLYSTSYVFTLKMQAILYSYLRSKGKPYRTRPLGHSGPSINPPREPAAVIEKRVSQLAKPVIRYLVMGLVAISRRERRGALSFSCVRAM